MSAAVAATTVQTLPLVPVPPVPVVPPAPVVPPPPAVPAVVPAFPPVPGLPLPPPPQLTDAARVTGNNTKEKRAIVVTVLTNMRGLQIFLKFFRSLPVWIVYTSIVVSCGCKGASGEGPDGPPVPTP